MYTFLREEITEIYVNENDGTNLDPDPERVSVSLKFSNVKCSACHELPFDSHPVAIDSKLTEIQVLEEMLT